MKNRNKRILRWTVTNGLIAMCSWAAVIQGSVGAGRVTCCALWLSVAVAILAASSDEFKAKASAIGRPVPAWLSHGFGMCLAGFFVWHGWWGSALAAVLNEFAESVVYSRLKKSE